jgi:hypothetical protein
MEVIMLLMCKAVELGILSPIGNCAVAQRVSIYADDVIIFIKPAVQDLIAVRELLAFFGVASGLVVNYRKTLATLIRQRGNDGDLVQQMQYHAIPDKIPRLAARIAPPDACTMAASVGCHCQDRPGLAEGLNR